MSARATPGVEVVEAGCYRRSIAVDGQYGYFEISLDESKDGLILRVEFPDPRALHFIVERVRLMFDLDADWGAIAATLLADPILAKLVGDAPGLRVPGCWDAFELTTRAILGQQISVKAATTLAGRMVRAFGTPLPMNGGLTHLFPMSAALAEANVAGIGLTRSRAATIQGFARAVRDGQISFAGIVDCDPFLKRLCQIHGIGQWTAQYVGMRALGEPDCLPSGDVGLLHALNLHRAKDLEKRAEAWRPWRSYATMYLWHAVSISSAHQAKAQFRSTC